MKILVAMHQAMDLGGIINHTEQLIGGLKDLGHTVHLKELRWAVKAFDQRKDGNFLTGPSGIPYNQGKGWNFRRSDLIPYKGGVAMNSAKQILSGYDIIIWTIPVPGQSGHTRYNNEWIELYDLPKKVKQIAISHDGNAARNYPYLGHIAEYFSGLACVHHCALNTCSFLEIPRALVLNPQFSPLRRYEEWSEKRTGFVNMQTFKAWKHVHELIEAIRFMPRKDDNELREVAGMGIEYRYMVSEDKCKDQYYHPDGTRFWDAAVDNGMTHHPYWNDEEVDLWLNRARVLVDPSWSKRYSKMGGHYNRVVVDAMIRGCVPVARRAGMGTDLFIPGEHYVEIPADVSPQEYGDIILRTSKISSMEARAYRGAARQVLPMFDRKVVAEQIIRLANGDEPTVMGTRDEELYQKADDIMFNHFGII